MAVNDWLRTPRGAILVILVASLLWGSAFPAIKRGYVLLGLEPSVVVGGALLFAAVRFFFAGALLLGGAALLRLGLSITRRQLLGLLLLGLVQTTLQYVCFYVGMIWTTGVKASVIVASGSFFLALLSPLFYRQDRLSRWKVLGLLLGFGGVVLANLARVGERDLTVQWLGDGLILGAGVSSAVASLISKRLVQDLHPVVVNGYQVTFGALALLAVALNLAVPRQVEVSLELLGLTVYLALVTSLAFTLYYVVVKHHELTRVAAYRFLIPIAGIGLSAWLIPGEELSWHLSAAAALVAFGIWLVNRIR